MKLPVINYKELKNNIYLVTVYNFLVVMLLFMLSRIFFYFVNIEYFENMTFSHFLFLCKGGMQFDLTALLYINILYLILMAIPFRFRYNNHYQTICKWLFITTNSVALIVNSIDTVYFKFTKRRTTSSVFSEFSNESNLGRIFLDGFIEYWYVSLFSLLIIVSLYFLYVQPKFKETQFKNLFFYYIRNTIALALIALFSVSGIRGGLGHHVRPITLSNANKYIEKPIEASIVLNTPFCMLRTIGKNEYTDPKYFDSKEELSAIFNPIIYPDSTKEFNDLNVVVFILESFSKEYIGELNNYLDDDLDKGYTPFLDSLIRNSLTFEHTFANGHRSIEAMPSVLASIPSLIEPFILTGYSSNKITSIASELNKKDYYTAFFHGAPNGSMGFEAFARLAEFQDYYGMNEYGNDADFDGTWAIWDEPFFQFYAEQMNTFKEPFMTSLFSASSHHPFSIPDKYKNVFKDKEGNKDFPIYKCVEYTDFALKRFFETASKMSWYKNTLFVITADHTNMMIHPEYLTDVGRYKVPIVFYYPGGDLKGKVNKIAQQTDIMPTVLGFLNYDKPYVAFGKDLLNSSDETNVALYYNKPVFQYFKNNYMYQFDGEKIIGIYDFIDDLLLEKNMKDSIQSSEIKTEIEAYIQQYVIRMRDNNLTIK